MSLITRPINGTLKEKFIHTIYGIKLKLKNADQFAHWSALIFLKGFYTIFVFKRLY
jgi:hypothetical protein